MRWIALLFIGLALAGCTDTEPTETETSAPETEAEPETFVSPWNVTSLNGTFAGNTSNTFEIHPVFFNWTANFILNGTEGDFFEEQVAVHVADENFTWSFDQDTDGIPEATGNLVPFNITVLYAPGNFTATLTMQGHGQNWTGTHNLSVQEFVPPIPPTIVEGIVSEPCVGCEGDTGSWDQSIGHLAGEPGIDSTWHEIPAELAGAPYVAVSTAGTIGVSFQDTCNGSEIDLARGAPARGIIPDGAGCVFMWEEGTNRGTKLTFIANGDVSDRPNDGMCWATSFALLGLNQAGVGVYQTDGTWFYAESNGVPGLQWSSEPIPGLAEVHKEGCSNPDMIII